MSFQILISLAVSSIEYHIPCILFWGGLRSSLSFPTMILSHAIKSSYEDEAVSAEELTGWSIPSSKQNPCWMNMQ